MISMEEYGPFQRWFGDFGGGFCADDITNYDQEQLARRLADRLADPSFEPLFQSMLKLVLPAGLRAAACFELADKRRLYRADNLSWYYSLAGQLALAQLDGKTRLCAGTRVDLECLILARAAQALGMELTLVLSRNQAQNHSLAEELSALGCIVDRTTCVKWPDSPYAYAMYHCESTPDVYVLTLEANFGCYPYPSLTGILAGKFGEALYNQSSGLSIDGVVVPIVTGTEAVGALRPWLKSDSGAALMTVEQPICEEYHITDMGAYTLATRSADSEEPNTTLCPELVSWWRSAKVARLGCDHYKAVDTAFLSGFGFTPAGARAAALALSQTDCRSLLILEVHHG